MRRGIQRRRDGAYRVRLPAEERDVLAALPGQLREALAAGEPTLSHGVAGTSAGCAYGPAASRSTSASGFSKNTFMLKCTLPVAPACARVSRICSRISLVRHRNAGRSIFPV